MAEPAPERMNSPLESCRARLRGRGRDYTATVQRSGRWWIGWMDEVPGVNSQGRTRDELLENLGSALEEALETQ